MSKRAKRLKAINGVISVFLTVMLVFSCVPYLSKNKSADATETQNDEQVEPSENADVNYESEEEQDARNFTKGRVLSDEEIQAQIDSGAERLTAIDDSKVDYTVSDETQEFESLKASTLPSSVDLRSRNLVGAVNRQDPWGTCWAQSANAAAEINIANKTGKSAGDYSPYHTAWFAYTALSTNTSDLVGTQKTQAGEGCVQSATTDPKNAKMDLGGYNTTAASTFMQGAGIVNESDFSYPKETSFLWNDTTRSDFEKSGGIDNSKRNYSLARLKSWSYLGRPCAYGGKTNMTVINRMKSVLNSGNAVEISYHSTTKYDWYMSSDYSQYIDSQDFCSDGCLSNHSVVVVGYDDNYDVSHFNSDHRPSSNGAFIVKNSHGSSWGKSGYFYLSYYDQSITEASVFDWDTDSYTGSYINNNSEVVDQYDYLTAMYVSGYRSGGWYSNMYTTYQKQTLHHIGTYYYTPGTTMKYRVYRLKDNATSPKDVAYSLDSPDAEGTYTSDYEGYVSIKLDTPVSLKKGEKYAIMFSGTAPRAVGSTNGCTTTAIINSNESFYANDPSSTWSSLTSTSSGTGDNFCVKGYSTVQGNTSKVTFNANGGTSSATTQTVTDGNKVSQPSNPTRSGWTFAGWYCDKSLTTKYNFNVGVTHDMTLYAKWAAKINYVLNGGTNASSNPTDYGAGVGVSSFANPTRTAYDFQGWYSIDGTTTGNWGSRISSISSDSSGEKTLYARWSPITYTITYSDSLSGTNNNVKNYTCETSDITIADAVKEGYDFKGWYSNSTGKQVTTIPKGSYGNIKLTAKWEAHKYSITYENTEGAEFENPATYTIEESKVITLNNAEKDNYTFGGWWTNDGTETGDWGERIREIKKKSTGDKTFYAKWIADAFQITYLNVNDAKNPNPKAFTVEDSSIKLQDPTRAGYDFMGWYDASGKKVTEVTDTASGDVTLSAKWQIHTYSISYKNCTGAYNPNPTKFNCNTASFILLEPTKPGYTFNSWTDSKGKTAVYFYAGATSNLTYTANWTPVSYSITYSNVSGATNPNAVKSYTADTATITLKNPTKAGYTFNGWYQNNGEFSGDWGKKVTQIKKGSSGDIELFAKWTKDVTATQTMWRLYNKYTGEHFYTSDEMEKDNLVAMSWADEGVGWYAPTKSSSSTPVYRLYNKYVSGGDHHYTMSSKEKDSLVKAGWSYEGIAWYSCKSTDEGAKPLYRQYNPNAKTGTHNYTLEEAEADNLVALGWKDEGKAWYGYSSND